MNKLLNCVIESRKGHYCHALELGTAYELECVIESIIDEMGEQFTLADYIDFFNSIELYYYYDKDNFDDCDKLTEEQQASDEEDLYALNIADVVTECYNGL